MGGVVSGVGKMFGGGGGGAKRNQAEQLQAEAFDYIENIRIPTLDELQIKPSDITYYQVTGKFTPELYQAVLQDKTLMEDLEANPDLIKQQLESLETINARIAEGGLSISDRARMHEVTKEFARQNQAQQETIAAKMREKGAAGSPYEMMSRLQGQGQAADQSADEGFKTAALAATSKMAEEDKKRQILDNLMKQDLGLKTTRASAADERAKLNTSLLNQQALTNTQLKNVAAMQNLQNEQRVSDANVGLSNQRMLANKEAIQQDLANRMNKGQLMAGAAGTYSKELMDQAARKDAEKKAKWDSIGGIVDTGAGAVASIFSDEALKTEISPADKDVDQMLSKLKPYSYEYKDKKHGEGKHTGIMAQDLEKSKMGKELVKELPEGKAIDVKKALGAIMASQARLSQRLKDIEKKGK